MAEIGLIASVIQVAGAGLALSKTLYQYADGVASADRRLRDIATEIQLTSLVVQELGDVFRHDETRTLMSKNAVKTANKTLANVSAVFAEIDELVKKSRKDAFGRLMLPFRDAKIEQLRSHIDKLKSTLQLLLQVLFHAHQVAAKKLDRQAEAAQKAQIQELIELSRKTTKNYEDTNKKYEESLKHFGMSDSSSGTLTVDETDQKATKTNSTRDLTIGALAFGSTINPKTLETCMQHVRTLLNSIENLQQALTSEVDGDDHSDHHQALVGSYFCVREHLDDVLLSGSKQQSVSNEEQPQTFYDASASMREHSQQDNRTKLRSSTISSIPVPKQRRPPQEEASRQYSIESSPHQGPRTISRTASVSAKRTAGHRRTNITQDLDDEDCKDQNCTTCVPVLLPTRRRPELPQNASTRNAPQHVSETMSQRSDPNLYHAPPLPTYTRQSDSARGPVLIQATRARRPSSDSRPRPQSFAGEAGSGAHTVADPNAVQRQHSYVQHSDISSFYVPPPPPPQQTSNPGSHIRLPGPPPRPATTQNYGQMQMQGYWNPPPGQYPQQMHQPGYNPSLYPQQQQQRYPAYPLPPPPMRPPQLQQQQKLREALTPEDQGSVELEYDEAKLRKEIQELEKERTGSAISMDADKREKFEALLRHESPSSPASAMHFPPLIPADMKGFRQRVSIHSQSSSTIASQQALALEDQIPMPHRPEVQRTPKKSNMKDKARKKDEKREALKVREKEEQARQEELSRRKIEMKYTQSGSEVEDGRLRVTPESSTLSPESFQSFQSRHRTRPGHAPAPNVTIYNTTRMDKESSSNVRTELSASSTSRGRQSHRVPGDWALEDEIAALRLEMKREARARARAEHQDSDRSPYSVNSRGYGDNIQLALDGPQEDLSPAMSPEAAFSEDDRVNMQMAQLHAEDTDGTVSAVFTQPTGEPKVAVKFQEDRKKIEAKRFKAHVASACVNCRKAHLSCDAQRPCSRCMASGKQDFCKDVQHKKRGRPRLRDDKEFSGLEEGQPSHLAPSDAMKQQVRPMPQPPPPRTYTIDAEAPVSFFEFEPEQTDQHFASTSTWQLKTEQPNKATELQPPTHVNIDRNLPRSSAASFEGHGSGSQIAPSNDLGFSATIEEPNMERTITERTYQLENQDRVIAGRPRTRQWFTSAENKLEGTPHQKLDGADFKDKRAHSFPEIPGEPLRNEALERASEQYNALRVETSRAESTYVHASPRTGKSPSRTPRRKDTLEVPTPVHIHRRRSSSGRTAVHYKALREDNMKLDPKDDVEREDPLATNIGQFPAGSDSESLAESMHSLLGFEPNAIDDIGATPTATSHTKDFKAAPVQLPLPEAPVDDYQPTAEPTLEAEHLKDAAETEPSMPEHMSYPVAHSSDVGRAQFTLEELDNDQDCKSDIEIVYPDCVTLVESDRSVSELGGGEMFERIKPLDLQGESSDEEEQKRRYRRKKKRWAAGFIKRSHCVEGDISYSDNDVLDDAQPTARRLRRRVRYTEDIESGGGSIDAESADQCDEVDQLLKEWTTVFNP